MPICASHLSIATFTAALALQAPTCLADGPLHVPSLEYASIQAAVDAVALDGPMTTIVLSPTTYFENVRVEGKNIYFLADPTKPSATVIDGGGNGSPLYLHATESNCTVVVRGLTLTGGTGFNSLNAPTSSRGGGLAIEDGYEVLVQECIIRDNDGRLGGGVDVQPGSGFHAQEVEFRSNHSDGRGGAINAWASCHVENCTFVSNSAAYGGHLCLAGGATAVHEVINSHFEAGNASQPANPFGDWSGSGGAISIDWNGGLTIQGCSFRSNHADNYGGAIAATPNPLLSFDACLYGDPACDNYDIVVDDCTFDGCSGQFGGAIAWVNLGNFTGSELTMENCIGHQQGGGFFSAFGTSSLSDCSFTTCLALDDGFGGGVRLKAAALTMYRTSLENCGAINGAGGGMSLEDADAYMYNCEFAMNASAFDGAAIHGLRSTVDDEGSIIRDHVRTAAVFLDLQDTTKRNEFTATQFIDNGADAEPGRGRSAVSLVQAWAEEGQQRAFSTFAGCTFEGNNGSEFGGGAIRTDGMWVELKEGIYRNNSTLSGATHGGVLHSRRARIMVWNGLYENNRSGGSGGAFYLEHTTFDANRPTFMRNKATLYGGAIESAFGSTGGVAFGTFDGGNSNNAQFGGAVDLDSTSGYFQLAGCSFENHRALNQGGAIYAGGARADIIDCDVHSNQATSGGGVQSSTKMTAIVDSTICGNTIDQVAGLFTDNGGNTIAQECCEGDVDGDGAINGSDLSMVLGAWGETGSQLGSVDINNDGIVNGADLSKVLGAWGLCND